MIDWVPGTHSARRGPGTTMKVGWILLGVAGAALSLPASAAVRAWRALGTVSFVSGTTSLLPLPAAPGDDFELEFSYDDAATDVVPVADHAGYEILSMRVTIAGSSLDWVGPGIGIGAIGIMANASDPNLWGASGCLGTCQPEVDEARLNFYFPPNTILSDALTGPPDPTGASVQFGLYSSNSTGTENGDVGVTLESVVPEPAGALLLAAGILVLGALRSASPRRR
jgi:hypothetical protein